MKRRAFDAILGEELVDEPCLSQFTAYMKEFASVAPAFNKVRVDETGQQNHEPLTDIERTAFKREFFEALENSRFIGVSCLGRTSSTAVQVWATFMRPRRMPPLREIENIQELGEHFDPTNACPRTEESPIREA